MIRVRPGIPFGIAKVAVVEEIVYLCKEHQFLLIVRNLEDVSYEYLFIVRNGEPVGEDAVSHKPVF